MGNLFSINSPLFNMVNKILHFLWLSILWVICSLPIVTIGASTTALYCVALKYAKKEEGYLTSSFLKAMKENFKQATLIWLLLLFVGSFLGIDFILYNRVNQTGIVPLLMLVLFFSIFVAYILSNIFIFPLLAQFDNSIQRTILNSFMMAVKHWPTSISMLMISFAILILGFKVFPPVLFIAPGLIAYINSKFFNKIFNLYIS